MKVEELVSKSSSTPILVKIWSATRKEAYSAGTKEPRIIMQGALLRNQVKSMHDTVQLCIPNSCEAERFAADLSEPWSDTAPPVWGRWICRSCWVQWRWQSCCPRRCSYCSIQAAVQPVAPEWGDGPAWWPACLWTLGALADTAEKKQQSKIPQFVGILFI